MKTTKDQYYKKSVKKEKLPQKIRGTSRELYRRCLQCETGELTEKKLQTLANEICDDFGVRRCRVVYEGTQPHSNNGKRLKSKTMGDYRLPSSPTTKPRIRLFKYTAKQKKVRATKSTLTTLLHEICHHLDYDYINLVKSPHTAGFYKRIDSLIVQLNK